MDPQSPPPLNSQQPAKGATDGLSITSMVLGILAVLSICCWPVSLVCAVLAIVFGHIGARSIKSSEGAKSGLGMAKAGYILGYVSILIIIAFIAFAMFTKGVSGLSPWEQFTSEGGSNLRTATSWIDDGMEGAVSGNSQPAKDLAESFAQVLTSMNDNALAVQRTDLFVWCELRSDKCAFVLQYGPVALVEAKKKIFHQRAWQAAQVVLQKDSSLPDGAEVAVATRGIIMFSDIFTGKLVRENNPDGTEGLSNTVTSDPSGEALIPMFSDSE